MIKLAAWNIRGLNDPLKKKEIRSFVRVHSIRVVCILETRVKSSNMDRICASILPGWGLIHNYDHALLGRIWVCWNTSVVSIDAIHCTDQAILCYITILKDNSSFNCSVIYASNNQIDRRVPWSHLHWCASTVGSNPWFLVGDFNTTRFSSEKNGGNMSIDTSMEEFHDCLFNMELADMPFLGPMFSWMNRRTGEQFIARKLDRSLQNECSLDTFLNVVTKFLNLRLSDHCPLIVNLNNCKDPSPKKSYTFKFFNFWANHPAFLDLVKDAWNIEFYGTPMYKLTQKLKSVKTRLKAFNFHVFANIREKVVDAREALQHAEAARLGNPNDPSLVENEKVCLKIFHDLALAEESFLKQKSRI